MTKYLNAKNGIEIEYGDSTVQLIIGPEDPEDVNRPAEVGSIYLRSTPPGGTYFKSDTGWTPAASGDDLVVISGTLQAQIDNIATISGGPGSGIDTFIDLLDTPSSYSDNAGKYPRVNDDGTGIYFDYLQVDVSSPEAPLIPETAISGTYFVNFEAGRLLVGATGNKPDLVYIGPVAGLAFSDRAEEACYGSFKIPYSWNTESNINMRINFMNDDAQSNVRKCAWKMDFHTYAPGETYTSKITTTLDFAFDLPNNCPAGTFHTYDLIMPPDNPNNPLSRGDILAFKFYRDGESAQDTVVGDAVLLTLMVEAQTGQHIMGDS